MKDWLRGADQLSGPKESDYEIQVNGLILWIATIAFAQTATQTKPGTADPQAPAAAAQTETMADCPCCQKMAEGKDAMACCQHDKNGKNAMACCDGKDGMACMKGDKNMAAKDCCTNGKCDASAKSGCCAKGDKTSETAMACCGAKGQHCGMGHDHNDINR